MKNEKVALGRIIDLLLLILMPFSRSHRIAVALKW